MTEEVKEATEVTEVTEVTEEKVEAVTEAPKKTPQEINKEKQGKKANTKKKVKHFTKTEALAELKRLEKAGHENSVYYNHVLMKAKELERS
jgi:hypothetical protein